MVNPVLIFKKFNTGNTCLTTWALNPRLYISSGGSFKTSNFKWGTQQRGMKYERLFSRGNENNLNDKRILHKKLPSQQSWQESCSCHHVLTSNRLPLLTPHYTSMCLCSHTLNFCPSQRTVVLTVLGSRLCYWYCISLCTEARWRYCVELRSTDFKKDSVDIGWNHGQGGCKVETLDWIASFLRCFDRTRETKVSADASIKVFFQIPVKASPRKHMPI